MPVKPHIIRTKEDTRASDAFDTPTPAVRRALEATCECDVYTFIDDHKTSVCCGVAEELTYLRAQLKEITK